MPAFGSGLQFFAAETARFQSSSPNMSSKIHIYHLDHPGKGCCVQPNNPKE